MDIKQIEDNKELFPLLLKVQSELKPITKNTKGYNYTYADLAHVWDNISSVLQTNKIIIRNEITQEGVRTYAHTESGTISSFIPFSKEDLKPQDRGSEITYYRRYNLTAIFNIIIEGEDDDAQKAQGSTKSAKMIQGTTMPPKTSLRAPQGLTGGVRSTTAPETYPTNRNDVPEWAKTK